MKKKPANFFLLLLCINISSVMYAQQTNVQDSLALVALYNSTDGVNWRKHTNWLTKHPVSVWYGITVSNTRVTQIGLSANNLNGPLPPELGNLSGLSFLQIANNPLSGSIPVELGNLSNLIGLYLTGDQLSGSIPPELGNLSNLTELFLYGNQLSGRIPPELGNLSSLVHLFLFSNSLNGSIPPELGHLTKLTDLDLGVNKLSGSIPPELGNLPNLFQLYLNTNKLSGTIPPELGNLSSLGYLALIFNQLSGSIPPELGKLSNLLALDLFSNQLSGSIPAELGNLSKLDRMDLHDNQLNGTIPRELGNLSKLTVMLLYDNQLSGSIPPELGNLPLISDLFLDHNELSGSIPPELSNAPGLYNLFLNNNHLSGGIPPEFGKLTALFQLSLNNNQLSGSIPLELSNLGPFFGMDISYNYFTFEGMEDLIIAHPFYIVYSPQANIPIHLLNDSSLYVSAGGTLSNNIYKWFTVGKSDSVTIAGDSIFHPSQDGKYYAAITNSICTKLTLHTDTIDFSGTMPVTIINLKAQLQAGIVRIDWTSVTETNVARYEIQRSANTVNFTNIGSVIAEGNGTAKHDYSFNDLLPQQGNNYYRLKIFDRDGKTSYSVVVSVNINNNRTITIVYPNPAKNILHIQTNNNASFSLINQSGKILVGANINGSGTMNVSSIAPGLYYLKNNSSGDMYKIIIAR